MTDKITLELTLDELKTLDENLYYGEGTWSICDKIRDAYPQTKTPVEEAYKKVFGYYPVTDVGDGYWEYFQNGYKQAQKDYKVREHQEPEELKTLYDALELPYFTIGYHFNEGQKHWICKVVKEWMSQYTCDYVMCAEYLKGYEECLTVLEENLK